MEIQGDSQQSPDDFLTGLSSDGTKWAPKTQRHHEHDNDPLYETYHISDVDGCRMPSLPKVPSDHRSIYPADQPSLFY